jgi:serine/threonine-protein kinase
MSMLVGKQFGPFKVESELGSGAMGSVYRGVDETTGKHVAIKIIAPGLATNPTAIERFLRESGVLKRLSHPNIARYLGSGRYHGAPFYIMEFIKGVARPHPRRGRILGGSRHHRAALPRQSAQDAGIMSHLKPSNLATRPTAPSSPISARRDTDASGLTATHSRSVPLPMRPRAMPQLKILLIRPFYSMGILARGW